MRTRPLTRRSRTTCSVLAMSTALVVGASPAAAQSLQGNGSFFSNGGGAANITPGANTTTVTLNSGQTVIDWTPFDNAVGNFGGIGFQYSGTTATFQSSGNFAVLNRINVADSTRVVSMDGIINGLVGGQTGGSIYFYSPSGFVLGSNAVINVGSLVLSASPLQLDGANQFITGANNTVVFGQAPNPNAAVTTVGAFGQLPGAQINASNYVAFVAPRVVHDGAITVNGQAALVGAEAATISFRPNGLFDIEVTSGTTDSNGVVVNGDINGPASSGPGDYRRAYMVAVPKNQAMTMVIGAGANLGFDIAGAADVEGNVIVLSAGQDVIFGSTTGGTNAPGTGASSISVNGVAATSTFRASATDTVTVSSNAGQSSSFAGNLSLEAGTLAQIVSIGAGASIAVGGNLFVNTSDYGQFGDGGAAIGGTSRLIAQSGGAVTVDGTADIQANGYGGAAFNTGQSGGDGTGGTVAVQALSGGSLSILGTLYASAFGQGGEAYGDVAQGGIGRGGTVTVQASGAGSSITIDQIASINANGYGGSGGGEGCFDCGSIGNDGFGGTAFLGTGAGAGASLTVDGSAFVTASGSGGYGDFDGGNGIGGFSSVTFGAGSAVQFNSTLLVEARGTGGTASFGDGGDGTGGRASIGSQAGATGGSIIVSGLATADASGEGGSAYDVGMGGDGIGGQTDNGGSSGTITFLGGFAGLVQGSGGYSESGTGGNGQGGIGWLDAFGATISVTGDYLLDASAFGGNGATGGDAIGGSAYLPSSSTHTVTGNASVLANGTGGSGFAGAGGNGTGGFANVRATGSGTLTVIGDVLAEATGNGGVSYGSGALANGGNGLGGQVYVQAGNGGSLNLGSLTAWANGWGGSSFDAVSQAGSGTGGRADLAAYGGSTILIGGDASVQATGSGNATIDCTFCGGFGGDGFGGLALVQTYGGGTNNVTISGNLTVDSSGNGSEGSGGASGSGTGGTAIVQQNTAGTLRVGGNADVLALGRGASHFGLGGSAGSGTGGIASVNASLGLLDIDGSLGIDVSGLGGQGGNGGLGGNGTGGRARIFVQAGNLAIGSSVDHNASLSARGVGGDAFDGVGGNGQGGFNTVEVNGIGTITIAADLNVDGSAAGGDGATGGNASAQTTTTDELDPDAGTVVVRGGGAIVISGSANLNGNATGGNGTFALTGGNGGSASAGELDVNAYVGSVTMSALNITAIAQGGNGGTGANGGDATGGIFDVTNGPSGQAINGTLNLGDVAIAIDAYGGAGGDGLDGLVGGNGGNGGNAAIAPDTANQFTANSAGGTINANFVNISARSFGGQGGQGGNGSNGAGGNGGNGGAAQGGFVQAGSISNNGSLTSGGSFNTGNLAIDTSVTGGNGGGGGAGSTIGGNGGNGGVAGTTIQSSAFLGIRGMVGTLSNVNLFANATGGNGGAGGIGGNANGISGNGGNAIAGRISVESRERFAVPAQRGTLIANAIYGEAIAIGGSGEIGGTSAASGNSSFLLYNGDATIGSFEFLIQADTMLPGAYDFVAIVDGAATVDGTFSFTTPGALSLYANRTNPTLDQASLTANDIILSANNFVPLVANATIGVEVDPAPNPGLFAADTFAITTNQDFYTSANIDSVNLFEINAPGSITANNITGDAEILLTAQSGSIDVQDINAGANIVINGGSGVSAGNITGPSDVQVYSFGGDVLTGALSGDTVNVYSYGGSVTTGDIDFGTYAYLYSANDIDTAIITGNGNFDARARSVLTFASIDIDGTAYLSSVNDIVGGDVSAANIYARAGQDFDSTGGSITLGDLTAVFDIDLLAATDIMIGSAIAGNDIDLETSGYSDEIGGDIFADNLTAGGSVGVDAGGLIDVADVSAGLVNPSTDPLAEYNIGLLAGTTLTAGDLASANHIGVAAPGALSTGNVDAANIFMALGGDSMSFGSITAGTNVYLANFSMMPLGGAIAGTFDPAPVLAADPVLSGGDIIIGGPVDAGIFQAAAGGAFSAQNIVSADLLTIVTSGDAITGDLTAATDIDLLIGGALSTGDVDGGGAVGLRSVGALNAGNVLSGGFLFIGSNASISTGDLASSADIQTRSDGNASFTSVDAALGIDLGSHGNLSAGTITAGESIRLGADGALDADDVTAGNSVVATSFTSITLGDVSAGIVNPSSDSGALYEVALITSGTLSTGAIDALGDVQLVGTAGVSTGAISTDARFFALSNGAIALGDLAIGQQILIGGAAMFSFTGDIQGAFDARPTFASAPVAVGGDVTLGNVSTSTVSIAALGNIAVGDIDTLGPLYLNAGGNLSAGSIQSLFSSIGLFAGGDISTLDLTAGTSITVNGGGAVQLGDVAAGAAAILLGIGTQDIGPGNPVQIFGAAIATGDINTDGYVGLYTPGSISTGTITALHDIIALAGGNVSFGAITTDESFTLAGYGNFAALNTPQGFNPSLLFALNTLSATGGNAAFTGSSSVQSFRSIVGGNTAIVSVASGSFAVFDSGGTISVTGAISAPDYVGLTSSDIDIVNGASIDSSAIGFISGSSNGTFIGDNLGGTGGYRLSQAEIDRTTSQAYEFEVSTDRGAAASMLIGDLTLDMIGSGNQDVAEFWIGDNQTGISSGTIRVVGDALFRVTPNQQVSFEATTFELDVATGSLSLLDGQNNLSGVLGLYAQNIFVASGDILTKLEADPRYAGYVAELNAPVQVQRPEGVLHAASMDIDSFNGPIQNIIVQNTGTADLPAGFLLTNADIGGGEFFPQPGSVNLVINGQIVTQTGTLTGVAVRDLLVSQFGSDGFVAGSTINGCLLIGGCGAADPDLLPPAINITPTQIAILTDDPLGESDFGNEPDIDDGIDGDVAGDASSPIEAPQPLFDARPLTDEGLIDDPISGAGNPSLYGVHSDEDDDDDDETDSSVEVKKGDGK
ncbi:MAG: hypothetical protein ABI667_00185 [Sphingomicrobium sp.]